LAEPEDAGVDGYGHARGLYESLGFTRHERGAGGPIMYVYEREL